MKDPDFKTTGAQPGKISALLEAYLTELEEHCDFGGVSPMQVTSANSLGDTPLHVAVRRGDAAVVTEMIAAGADVNAVGEENFTPLHCAVMYDDAGMVCLLLQAGGGTDNLNTWGETLMETARRRKTAAVIEALERAQR